MTEEMGDGIKNAGGKWAWFPEMQCVLSFVSLKDSRGGSS